MMAVMLLSWIARLLGEVAAPRKPAPTWRNCGRVRAFTPRVTEEFPMRSVSFVIIAVLALGGAACTTGGDTAPAGQASASPEITPLPASGPAGSTAITSAGAAAGPGVQ